MDRPILQKLSAFLESFNTWSGRTATETERQQYIAEDVSAYDKKFQKLTLKTDMLSRKCRTEWRGKWMVMIDWLSLTYHWMIEWLITIDLHRFGISFDYDKSGDSLIDPLCIKEKIVTIFFIMTLYSYHNRRLLPLRKKSLSPVGDENEDNRCCFHHCTAPSATAANSAATVTAITAATALTTTTTNQFR